MGDGVEGDAMLREQGLIFPEAVDEIALMRLLLPAAGRLRRDDATLYSGLDAVGTRLLLVATDLSLLTQDTRVASGQFHHRRLKCGAPRGRRQRKRRGLGGGQIGGHGLFYGGVLYVLVGWSVLVQECRRAGWAARRALGAERVRLQVSWRFSKWWLCFGFCRCPSPGKRAERLADKLLAYPGRGLSVWLMPVAEPQVQFPVGWVCCVWGSRETVPDDRCKRRRNGDSAPEETHQVEKATQRRRRAANKRLTAARRWRLSQEPLQVSKRGPRFGFSRLLKMRQ